MCPCVLALALLTCDVLAMPPCRQDAAPSTSHQFTYESGQGERAWLRGKAKGHICQIGLSSNQVHSAQQWVDYAAASFGTGRVATEAEALAVSKLRCDDGRDEVIEPLSGVARHPFAFFMNPHACEPKYMSGCGHCSMNRINRSYGGQRFPAEYAHRFRRSTMDVTHIILHNRCPRAGERMPRARSASAGRNLFYDLGCGNYSRADGAPVDLSLGQGLGPSIPLFSALYERNCIVFDEIYAWEYIKYDPQVWWARVPAAIRGKLHFYNTPVEREPSTSPGSFVQLLKSTATADDFVAIKLDIDHPDIEMSIINQILLDPQLASLVDEIFFEMHFHFDGINFGWESGRHSNIDASVDDALYIMHRLRLLGIRSHFWI